MDDFFRGFLHYHGADAIMELTHAIACRGRLCVIPLVERNARGADDATADGVSKLDA